MPHFIPGSRTRFPGRCRGLADRLEREGVEQFLDAWLAQPLFAGLTEEMQFRAERRENTVDGLAESLRQAGTGAQDPSVRSRRSRTAAAESI